MLLLQIVPRLMCQDWLAVHRALLLLTNVLFHGLVDVMLTIVQTVHRRLEGLRLLEAGLLRLENDLYTFELAMATIDRAPFDIDASNGVLECPVVLPELPGLVFDKLIDEPTAIC